MGLRTPGTAPFLVPTLATPAGCWGGCNTGAGKVSTFQCLSSVLMQPGISTGIFWDGKGTITVLAPWPAPKSCLLVLGEGFLEEELGCCSVSQGVCTYPQGCDFSHLIPAIYGASSTPSTLALLETQRYFYRKSEPRGLLSAGNELQLWEVSSKRLRKA